ncbi:MAG: LON peptidase substrate-binding domain-containing protein [Anaerolineae bacterium]|nr:LON peptidase substrate-binding domain-containing protein [Anaerolineae bacterium]
MERLPLFPLNTVLFPGMPIHLHIFEDRYKLMIARCIETRSPFGVVLIQTGSEITGEGPDAVPHPIGCTAQITQVQPLGDGRMNLVAMGHERFRILSHNDDEPYMTGDVELLALVDYDAAALTGSVPELQAWLKRYLQLLEKVEHAEFSVAQLPNDGISLLYLAATILRITSTEKQELLGENNPLQLAAAIKELLRREVTLMEIMTAPVNAPQFVGTFSIN